MKTRLLQSRDRQARAATPQSEEDRIVEISVKAKAHYDRHGAGPECSGSGLPLIEVVHLEVNEEQYGRLREAFECAGLSMLRNRR